MKRWFPIAAAAAVLTAGGGAFLAVRAPSAEQVAARAVGHTIQFRAEVREELPFAFSVEPERITLKPGETGSALFHVRNLSEETITAKAGHLLDPPAAHLHVDLVRCFCFFEDTLAPGEERQLPVVLRLGWDVPADLGAVTMLYEYYPLARFRDRRPAAARGE